jgi:hypothetical protein
MTTPASHHYWAELVRGRANASGLDLPVTTVDELAMHLADVYREARSEGLDDESARAQAVMALDESGFTPLQRHVRRSERNREKVSLDMIGALRVAVRQFQQHPTFALVVVLVLGHSHSQHRTVS